MHLHFWVTLCDEQSPPTPFCSLSVERIGSVLFFSGFFVLKAGSCNYTQGWPRPEGMIYNTGFGLVHFFFPFLWWPYHKSITVSSVERKKNRDPSVTAFLPFRVTLSDLKKSGSWERIGDILATRFDEGFSKFVAGPFSHELMQLPR